MKTFLPRAAQTRTYSPVMSSVPHGNFLSPDMFTLQLSSCKKLQALKSLYIAPLRVVGICWSPVPFHTCRLFSPGILLLTLL